MNSIVGPILIKFLVKKDVCESHEQCTRPTDSAISIQCVDVQSASGSHMKLTSSKKKKKKKKRLYQIGKSKSSSNGTTPMLLDYNS